MDNELENLNSENEETTEDIASETDDTEEQVESEDTEDKYTERERQLYARLKKTEAELQEAKKAPKPAPAAPASTGDLSTADIIALTKANIEPEDIDEVLDYAKHKKLSVTEALKSSVVKAILAEAAEHRKSAAAVDTGRGRRAGSAGVSDEKLLSDAAKGIMPESDADYDRLMRLRSKRK